MTNGSATGRRVFVKMHGCGNDFAVFDARTDPLRLGPEEARAIADRRTGIGCDQVLTILPSQAADAVMRIQNADGSEVAACGNGARCVASVLALEALTDMVIETGAGLLNARVCGDGRVTVDMGAPRLEWNEIPLARPQDTLKLDLSVGSLSGPAAVSMGNPHAVFFVEDAEIADLAKIGRIVETHELFPERTNVSLATVKGPEAIRLRVWERGTGITRACGTAACATLVAAHRRGLTGREAVLLLDGGTLKIAWDENDHVQMTGPAEVSFAGEVDIAALVAAREAAA